MRSGCEIRFNSPIDPTAGGQSQTIECNEAMFSFRLDADTRDTVADVKRAMVDAINKESMSKACTSGPGDAVGGGGGSAASLAEATKDGALRSGPCLVDPALVHCRRGVYVGGTHSLEQCEMVKDETQTMAAVGVFNGSAILLCHGKPLPPGAV
jgi:hypothetical protein